MRGEDTALFLRSLYGLTSPISRWHLDSRRQAGPGSRPSSNVIPKGLRWTSMDNLLWKIAGLAEIVLRLEKQKQDLEPLVTEVKTMARLPVRLTGHGDKLQSDLDSCSSDAVCLIKAVPSSR
ncbi:hypothetical protein U9M48_033969 [Paspalum notatum var. saurae]|uniref:Uncharacterized protein n=1 Tax=Paspalum notatum var. saurae TaxID=547442 RepID=A0AAQ3X8G9_PASNO